MPDQKQHDPLDPLEAAYAGTDIGEVSTPSPADQSEIFHGEPVVEEGYETAEELEPLGSPPPPPPFSPAQQILRLLPFIGGFVILVLIIYAGYRYFFERGGTVELTYWMLWEEKEVLQPLIDEYQREHPEITIDFVRQTPIQYRERVEAHIARGEGPDIFRFHNTWVPMLREELAPLPEGVVTQAEFAESFYPVMVEDLKLGGNIVGIPLMYEGLVVFYNEDILKAVGFSAPADNWDDFLAQAEDLTVKQEGSIVTAGAALGRADNVEHFADVLGLMFLQNGTNPARPNSEEGIRALTFYRLFAQTPDNVWGAEFDNDIIAFAQGKVAMIFAPSWEVFTIRAINSDLNFKAAPVPQVRGTQNPLSWASYWVEGVNSRSVHQKEAWDFLKFLAQKESLEKFYGLAAQVSANRSFGEPFSRKDMANILSDNLYLNVLLQQANNAKSFYMASRTFDNGINDRIINYYKDAVNSLDGGNSPEAALQTAAAGVQQVLATYNVRIE